MNRNSNPSKSTGRLRRARVGAIVLGLLAVTGCADDALETDERDDDLASSITDDVVRDECVSAISATGTVEALSAVEVGAELSGRILSLDADFNDTVTEGQILARIDSEQHRAAVAQARARMLAARANVVKAEATLDECCKDADRVKELASKGLASSKALESAVARSARAEASLQSAHASAALSKASLDAARSELASTEVVCPIDGIVLSREVEVGQTINAGLRTPVLFVIAEDLRRMRLSALVDEADIGKVREGQTAAFTVDAYPQRRFSSCVTAVRNVPQTDQNVVSYEVLLSVDNSDMLLKPGMTASVEIVTDDLADVL